MAVSLQSKINGILGLNQKTDEEKQLEKYQKSVNKLIGDENNTEEVSEQTGGSFNPYLKKDGTLVNKFINYQQLIDNPNTSSVAKKWMMEATGLSESGGDATIEETDGASSGGYTPNGRLGYISAKYETGGYDGGLVSSGSGDYGGVSYGIPQFSTATGSANGFVKWLKSAHPEMGEYFGSSTAGSSAFGDAWKQTYKKYGDKFSKAQTDYAYQQFVQPLVKLAKEKTGVDYTRSNALMELIYSTAIQFGGGSLGLSALGNVNANMSDTDIINASYDNKIANYKSYFKSSSADVQESVRNRFKNERNDVLALVGSGSSYRSGMTSKRQNSRTSSKGAQMVSVAKKYLGTPYSWGGTSPSGFDCSGLVQYAASKVGISVPRTTYEQIKGGKEVSKNNLQPGDLVFFGSSSDPHHVGIYIGGGQYIHSPKTGDVVKVSSLNGRSDYLTARRYA